MIMSDRYARATDWDDFILENDNPDRTDLEEFDIDFGLSEDDLESMHDEFFKEIHGEDTVIAGQTFDTVYAYRELDNPGYRESFNDWLDSEVKGGTLVEF
jgi:hypothetical protein